jgi:hypothetical protein
MKRFGCIMLLLIVAFGVSNALGADQGKYKIKPGETLAAIAARHNTTPGQIKDLNPGLIKSIHHIESGWVINVPVSTSKASTISSVPREMQSPGAVSKKQPRVIIANPNWVFPGWDKYRGTLAEGLEVLGYSKEEQEGLLEEVKAGRFVWAGAEHISKGGLVTELVSTNDENQSNRHGDQYHMMKMLCGGGPGRAIKLKESPDGIISSWKDEKKSEAGKIYRFGKAFMIIFLECGNPTVIIPSPKKTTPEMKPVTPPPSYSPPPGIQIVPPEEEEKEREKRDLYVGFGNYHARPAKHPEDNNGGYGWTKYREKPWWFDYDEKTSIGVGGFGFASGGLGKASKFYLYNWWEAVVGPTLKVNAEHSDYDLDSGLGWLWNRGNWRGNAANRQKDTIWLTSAHANLHERRDFGEEFFPETEVNLEYRHILSKHSTRGDSYDNRVLDFNITPYFYDFELGENNSLVVAVGWNINPGYAWGPDDNEFFKTGPALKFMSFGNTIAGISLFNYQWQDSGQVHPFGGYVSIFGSLKALEVYQIREATALELRNLPANGESKLLFNPADYL